MSIVDQHIDGMVLRNLIQGFCQCFQIEHIHIIAMHSTWAVFLSPSFLLLGEFWRPTDGNEVGTVCEEGLGKRSSEKSGSAC